MFFTRIFLPPFELLDLKEKKLLPLSQETVQSKDLGNPNQCFGSGSLLDPFQMDLLNFERF